jgi:hypothetical protein
MSWRRRISEDAGVDYLESIGGNKKRVAKPSFLCNFQRKVEATNVIVTIHPNRR